MPFSFSNIGAGALILMVAVLAIAELVKSVHRHQPHLKK